jgi:hypothetical protein
MWRARVEPFVTDLVPVVALAVAAASARATSNEPARLLLELLAGGGALSLAARRLYPLPVLASGNRASFVP